MGLLSSQNLPRYVILSFGYAGPLHLLKFLANLNYERQKIKRKETMHVKCINLST